MADFIELVKLLACVFAVFVFFCLLMESTHWWEP
jgi:hypothetical protein